MHRNDRRTPDQPQPHYAMAPRVASLKQRDQSADDRAMSDDQHMSKAPKVGDAIEIADTASGERARGVVDAVTDAHYVLRVDATLAASRDVRVRWWDGDTAWQAASKLERIDETSAAFELVSPHAWERSLEHHALRTPDWEPAQIRQSLRAPTQNAPLLVEVVEGTPLALQRRIHAVCLDFSESGCRMKWPGRPPATGDAVKVAWEGGDDHEPHWLPARVIRTGSLPFGAREVALTFLITDATQRARVRTWHHAWLHNQRQQRTGRAA